MAHVPHMEMTVERCRQEPVVLAIQDTTTLNYRGLEATDGLVNLGGGGGGTPGILAHVAITEARRPLLNATERDGTLTGAGWRAGAGSTPGPNSWRRPDPGGHGP